jgi:hypothetical protein
MLKEWNSGDRTQKIGMIFQIPLNWPRLAMPMAVASIAQSAVGKNLNKDTRQDLTTTKQRVTIEKPHLL